MPVMVLKVTVASASYFSVKVPSQAGQKYAEHASATLSSYAGIDRVLWYCSVTLPFELTQRVDD